MTRFCYIFICFLSEFAKPGELNKCLKGIESENYIMTMLIEENDNKTLRLIIEHKENENN